MAWSRPTQEQIVARVMADLEAQFPGADARLWFTYERVAAKVIAKVSHLQHGHLDWVSRQPFPDTADEEILDRLIYDFGLSDGQGGVGRKPATQAVGYVQVNGVAGGTISAGDVVLRADGTRYTVDANYTFTIYTSVPIAITAVEVGEDGNADPGTAMTFEVEHVDVETDCTVDGLGLNDGADREGDDNARIRLLAKLRAPGSGGGPGDYIVWAQEATVNVTRAWELPLYPGVGDVLVLIANDNLLGDIVPSQSTVDLVQEYLQKKTYNATLETYTITGKAPVTVDCTVQAIDSVALDYEMEIELEDGVAEEVAKAAIEAEVAAYIKRVAEPGVTITQNQLIAAVGNAAGVKNVQSITVPTGDTTHTAVQVPIPGVFTPTWV